MTQKMSYLVDLSKLKFDESVGGYSSWIQAMPLGEYKHPLYGKINITDERTTRFADNVNNKVRETELDIDYDHKEYSGEAAGWVQQAEARPGNGLWILVEWTKKAYEAIKSKAYRYFSPEFDDEWIHPRTGEKFKDVLFGGGITNRPFLKGIVPLNLSESFADGNYIEEKNNMTPEQIKEMAAKLGLGEDATPEMVYGAFVAKFGTTEDSDSEDTSTDTSTGAPEQVGASAGPASQYSENSVIKTLSEKLEAQSKLLREMEVSGHIAKLNETATKAGRIISTVVETGIKKLLSDAPNSSYTNTLVKVLSDTIENVGPLNGEIGGQTHNHDAEADVVNKFEEAVRAKMLSDKLSYADAAVLVAASDAAKFDEYRNSSYVE